MNYVTVYCTYTHDFTAVAPVVFDDPCVPNPCGPNSHPPRVVGSRCQCNCLPEMIGSPPNCRPECVVNSDCPSDKACINRKCQDPCPGLCGVNAYCSVRNHVPICICNQGYIGDPFSTCYRPTSKIEQRILNIFPWIYGDITVGGLPFNLTELQKCSSKNWATANWEWLVSWNNSSHVTQQSSWENSQTSSVCKSKFLLIFCSNNTQTGNYRPLSPITLWYQRRMQKQTRRCVLYMPPWAPGQPLYWVQTRVFYQPRLSYKPCLCKEQVQGPVPWCVRSACALHSPEPQP